ncbi:hypothetical protein QYE76_000804 [Lolium multiflorum]|uniref:Uncharacterized protein n=1 Tax=Lolium multiflorum TaxID=4521 RepID=A0AAD8RJX9_LOLMU|nr:hypothetical protein QYE76_000804 [Lolium multiflorum]
MGDGEALDVFADKISSMAARYANLGATLDDEAMVKKLLDSVPDRLYPAVAGIEQFCDVEKLCFDEALGRLKAFEERTERRKKQANGGDRGDGELLLTAAQWAARRRNDDDDDGGSSTASGAAGKGRKGRCHNCGRGALAIAADRRRAEQRPAPQQRRNRQAGGDDGRRGGKGQPRELRRQSRLQTTATATYSVRPAR